MDVKGTILPIDSENVSEERFFFSLENADLL